MAVASDRPQPSPAGAAPDDGRGVTIAVDAMGGDHGPAEVVPGAIDHAHANPRDRVLLVGVEATIRAMVARIIDERLKDGQFDECDLTLRDIERIREAFVSQLLGMYHQRIAYPRNKIVEIESRRASGG